MGAIIYLVLGYWAVGQTIYKNKILIGTTTGIIMKKVITGGVLGWILIPIAVIKIIIQIFSKN